MNEWLVVFLCVIIFMLVACVIMAIAFGSWFGVTWVTSRLKRGVRNAAGSQVNPRS